MKKSKGNYTMTLPWGNKVIFVIRLNKRITVEDKSYIQLDYTDKRTREFIAEVYSYLRKISHQACNYLTKDDLTEELWLKTIELIDKYKPAKGTFFTFLTSCLTNYIRDVYRCPRYRIACGGIGESQEVMSNAARVLGYINDELKDPQD